MNSTTNIMALIGALVFILLNALVGAAPTGQLRPRDDPIKSLLCNDINYFNCWDSTVFPIHRGHCYFIDLGQMSMSSIWIDGVVAMNYCSLFMSPDCSLEPRRTWVMDKEPDLSTIHWNDLASSIMCF